MLMGIWIDHRRAVLVALNGTEERLTEILSEVEKHSERAGDSPMKGSYEPRQVPADDSRQRALSQDLNRYYDEVVARARNAQSIFLFGPGEAKGELRTRLIRAKLGGHIAAVETTDKMSDREIAAHAREHFSGPRVPQAPESGRPNAGLQGEVTPIR